MSYADTAHGIQQYQSISKKSVVACAGPHQLITLLFDGVLERVLVAKGALIHKDVPTKGIYISKAINIIAALRAYLNMDEGEGKEMAENLHRLYDYIERRLFDANYNNSPEILDEVTRLINEIRDGWVAIAPQDNKDKPDESAPPQDSIEVSS